MYSYTFLDSNPTLRIDKDFMPVDNKVHLSTFEQSAIAQATLKVDSSRHTNTFYASDVVHVSFLLIPLIGWCALITSLLVAFFRHEKESAQTSISDQTRQNRLTLNSKRSIPCSRCRFFSSNSYIHCAVHPSKVLTEEAVNCSDYHSSQ